jgi:hypothetical protein
MSIHIRNRRAAVYTNPSSEWKSESHHFCVRRYAPRDVTSHIAQKVLVVEKVFFCICYERISVAFTRVKYQGNRQVATLKKFCLSTVGR